MAVLKKVHKGTVTFADTDTSKTGEPINASIDTSKSFLIFTVNGSSSGTNDSGRSFLQGWISSSTTLDFERDNTAASGETFTIKWQVFEFESGVSVQRGVSTALGSSNSVDISISTVDINKAFAVLYGKETGDFSSGSFAHLQFTSSNNLRAESHAAALDSIRWEVVEINNATVQQVVVSDSVLNSSATSASKTITAVDMDKTFLIGSYKMTGSGGTDNDEMWAWHLTDSNTITFVRNSTAAVGSEAVIFVVTVNDDDFKVQRGNLDFSASIDFTKSVTLEYNLRETRDAGVLLSGYPFNYGSVSSSSTNASDGRIYTAEITGINTLGISREDFSGSGTVYWEVIEWGRDTSTIYLSDLTEVSYTSDFGSLSKDESIDGRTITIGGFTYEKGLGAHAACTIVYDISGLGATRFKCVAGIDDETANLGSATWEVWNNDTNTKIAQSGILTGAADNTYTFDVDISNIDSLKLINTDAGDGFSWDHTDWADARILVPAIRALVNFQGTDIIGSRTRRAVDFDDGVTNRWNFDGTANGQLFTDAVDDRKFSGGMEGKYFDSSTDSPFLKSSDDAFGYYISPGSNPSYGLLNIVWVKDNFNDLKSNSKVFCNASSKFTLTIPQALTVESGTNIYCVIKSGSKWYISETDICQGSTGTFTLENFNNNSSTNKRWSEFSPTATNFGRPSGLTYTAQDFVDVQAVGFINEQERASFSHNFRLSEFVFEASLVSGSLTRNVLFFGSNF